MIKFFKSKNNIIYLPTHNYTIDIKYKILKLNKPFILGIISDPKRPKNIIVKNYKNIINNKNCINILSENWNDINHKKLINLPIGFSNDFIKFIDNNNNISSNKLLNVFCFNKINNNLIEFKTRPNNYKEIVKIYNNYSFIYINNNIFDSFDFYEAIYCNVIPIIDKSHLTVLYEKHFPCCIINDINEINIENLKKWKINNKKKLQDKSYCYMKYWEKYILNNITYKESILFYGASLTQQKSGYVTEFSKICKDEYNVKRIAHGGTHLNNSGIIKIKECLDENPNYVFIDWFSTGYTDKNNETLKYIDNIIYKLSEKDIKIIFLFFPRDDHNCRISFYNFVKKHLKKNSILYIDLNNIFHYNRDIIKDSIHTNLLGSNLYAKYIKEIFIQKKPKIKNIDVNLIKKNEYYDIKYLKIYKNVHKLIELKGNGKIIGFFTKIGNYSGIVEINIDGNIFEENLWDRWCHYERLHYNLNFEYKNYVNIKILDKKFDTSLCKDKMDFSKIKKKIDLKKIYYIGELKLINIL